MDECPKCRTVFPSQPKYCERCGYRFSGHDHRQNGNRWWIFMAGLGFLFFLFVVAAWQRTLSDVGVAARGQQPAPPRADTGWVYDDTPDGMGREQYLAMVLSSNVVNFDFSYAGPQHASLSIRANRTLLTM